MTVIWKPHCMALVESLPQDKLASWLSTAIECATNWSTKKTTITWWGYSNNNCYSIVAPFDSAKHPVIFLAIRTIYLSQKLEKNAFWGDSLIQNHHLYNEFSFISNFWQFGPAKKPPKNNGSQETDRNGADSRDVGPTAREPWTRWYDRGGHRVLLLPSNRVWQCGCVIIIVMVTSNYTWWYIITNYTKRVIFVGGK